MMSSHFPTSDAIATEDTPSASSSSAHPPRHYSVKIEADDDGYGENETERETELETENETGYSSADVRAGVTTDDDDDNDGDDDDGRGATLQPVSLRDPDKAVGNFNQKHKLRVRMPTVYDAVEGRIFNTRDQNLGMFSKPDPFHARESTLQRARRASTRRRTHTQLRRRPVPPEEVLFRFAHAPTRYAEHDVYMAHERELAAPLDSTVMRKNSKELPDSDMLGAVHAYASRFYATLNRRLEAEWTAREEAHGRRGQSISREYPYALSGNSTLEHVDERSMDETALLAFGILLEEAGREALGRRGHLIFTEGVEDEEEGGGSGGEGEGEDAGEDLDEDEDDGASRPRKRRRVDDNDDDW